MQEFGLRAGGGFVMAFFISWVAFLICLASLASASSSLRFMQVHGFTLDGLVTILISLTFFLVGVLVCSSALLVAVS